jgi:4-diphosphocytidyl-2-C-methyl-D-erythritol kinase
MLDSLVVTIDLADSITLTARSDDKITVSMCGSGSENIAFDDNNAVKAARLFLRQYGTTGVDIAIEKAIPMGAGLGGSSADVAGVLRGMAKLYDIHDEQGLKALADLCGSDSGYLMTGGYARLTGRGECVSPIDSDLPLYFLLLTIPSGVSTPQCYRLYDEMSAGHSHTTRQAIEALSRKRCITLCQNLSNALYAPAKKLNPAVENSFQEASLLKADAVNMTGSGSCVYAVFLREEDCLKAFENYHGNAKLYAVHSVWNINKDET